MTSVGKLREAVRYLVDKGGSDIHLPPGQEISVRVNGKLRRTGISLTPEDTTAIFRYLLDHRPATQRKLLEEEFRKFLNIGFSVVLEGVRFRVNASMKATDNKEGRYIVLREIKENPPELSTLGFSSRVMEGLNRLINSASAGKFPGLFLVVGPTGSGKSTTLASIIRALNYKAPLNIITLEDPIEYVHQPAVAQVVQKEYKADFLEFSRGLHSALREDPDIILVGEIRDWATFDLALKAAETGHLVFSTLHTSDSVATIRRLCSMADREAEVRDKLSQVLRGVVAQKLLLSADGTRRVLVYEAFFPDLGALNLIKEGKDRQIYSLLDSLPYSQSFEETLAQLVASGKIDPKTAFSSSHRAKELLSKFEKFGIKFDPKKSLLEGGSSDSEGSSEVRFDSMNL